MMNDLIGKQIDQNYRIDALLGQGGMGAVYRAYDLNLARLVALKVMHAQLAGQPEFKARFLQEAQAVARLSHPSIVTIHHFGQSQGLLYMVMEYIPGGSLSAHLRQLQQSGHTVQLRETLLFLAQVADALGYAHRHGVVHRDIKPSNVLVQRLETPEGEGELPLRAVVTDFGLVKLLTGGVETRSDALLGTYPYMSPEQCLGQPVDGRSDIYSLGVMLYQLTTGKFPLDIQSATDAVLKHHTREKPLPPREAWPGLPVSVEAIIDKAIAHEPEDRYQTGEAVASALREAAKSLADEDITAFESQRTVQSLSTRLELGAPVPEPSRMGIDLPPASPGDRLVIAQKEHTPRTIPLHKAQLTLGRAKENDIHLDHPDVSRQHARLERTSTGWQVTDLGSTNGTYLEGNRLLADIPEELPPGKTLRLGPYFLHWERSKVRSAEQSAAKSSLLRSGASRFQSNSGQIGVIIQHDKLEIMPGGRAQVEVEVSNLADRVDHFSLRIQGLPQAWYTIPDSTLELMDGARGALTFDVHPPQDSSAVAGSYSYRVIVASEARAGESVKVPCDLTVKPFERFALEVHPTQISDEGTTQVTIRNEGNADGIYNLSGRDPADAIQFSGTSDGIRVSPGGAVVQEVRANARQRPLFGTRQTLPFEIEAKSTTGVQQVVSGQLGVTPSIPMWIVPLVIVLFACCFLAGPPAIGALVTHPRETAQAEWVARTASAVKQEQAVGTERAVFTATAFVEAQASSTAAQETAIAATNIGLTSIALGDDDGDGLTNQREMELGLDPKNPDVDGDGLNDGQEVNVLGTDPQNRDTDGDTLLDGEEVNTYHTQPKNPDTDGDTVNDGDEIRNGTDPLATPTPTPVPPTLTPSPTLIPPPTPTEIISAFPGTWLNIYEIPVPTFVSYGISRLVIKRADQNTATLSACRCISKSSCNQQIELDPPIVIAKLQGNELIAQSPFNLADKHTLMIVRASKANSNLAVTVQETLPNGDKSQLETFEMKLRPPDRVGPILSPFLDSCEPPVFKLP